jgi:hypothetical protein
MGVVRQSHAPAALPSRNDTGIHRIRDWLDFRAVLDRYGEEKVPCYKTGHNPVSLAKWLLTCGPRTTRGSMNLDGKKIKVLFSLISN